PRLGHGRSVYRPVTGGAAGALAATVAHDLRLVGRRRSRQAAWPLGNRDRVEGGDPLACPPDPRGGKFGVVAVLLGDGFDTSPGAAVAAHGRSDRRVRCGAVEGLACRYGGYGQGAGTGEV